MDAKMLQSLKYTTLHEKISAYFESTFKLAALLQHS